MTNANRYCHTIDSFSRKRILVIGDLILDIYLKGTSTRLCPEAPVPVVDVRERTILPGGAANTVCNLTALGASVAFCTVVGMDADGDEAIALMRGLHIDDANITRDTSRKTITKSRVVSGSQVITRIDEGSETPVDAETTRVLIAKITREYALCDAIVISDYDKGVVTPPLIDALIKLREKNPKFIAVDSKRLAYFARLKPSLVKPNYEEAVRVLDIPRQQEDRTRHVIGHSQLLLSKLNAQLIAVTLDAEGSVVINNGKAVATIPAPQIAKPHVSGAGDTYLSAFVLSHLSGNSHETSATIATAAATVAVRKECTSTCSQGELKGYFNIDSKLVADVQDLKDICDAYHHAGKRIVFTNGCFDILHSGHVTYLHRAKELGDVLIVGLNNDESIQRIKGKSRPINALPDRLKVLAGLSSIDHIVAFGNQTDDTPIPLIRLVRPHIFVKGGDYTADKLPEAETVVACGGEIVFLNHVANRSTTRIINRISELSKNPEKIFSELPS